ncbi:MAG: TetR/AcrR family transcriptional regulator [Mycobacteriales bacterium]
MTRAYQLKRRAAAQEETRHRIVQAAVALHQERGPALTSFTDIAARAGVGRMTVYRHFPDEQALFTACSGAYFEQHPLPDVAGLAPTADPAARLRAALRAAYDYHRETEPMMVRVLAQVGDEPVTRPYHEHWQAAADRLAEAAAAGDPRRRATVRAAVLLALSFQTRQLLVRKGGLTDEEAAEVASRFVLAAAAPAA